MKTGILSMQMVDNYGSLLQAYGLKKIVESLGSSVEFIDIKKIEEDYVLTDSIEKYHFDESEEKTRLQKLFDKKIFVRLRNKVTIKLFKQKCRKFRIKELEISKKSTEYDLCIIGSDEVFNCLNAGWWGYTSQLFGNVSEAKKIITYAASCGATKFKDLPEIIKTSINRAICNISKISVRDNNTYDFMKEFGVVEIERNLDPVLIYDFDTEVMNAKFPRLPKHYCVIYSYSYRFYQEKEINTILEFCDKYNLTPIAIQGEQTWCKKFIACNPFECLKVFAHADFVITDTFHGTIFSAKYANKFAVIIRDSNANKLEDLIKKIGIEKHVLRDISYIESIYNVNKDKDAINKILKTEQIHTIKFLKKYINEDQKG